MEGAGDSTNNQQQQNHHNLHHHHQMLPPMGAPPGIPPPGLFMPPYPQMYPGQGLPQGQHQQQAPLGMPAHLIPPPPLIHAPKFDEDYEKNIRELGLKLSKIKEEIEAMPRNDLEKFKDQKLPLARIKKIMKSDEDVRMISAEAPILFAKACEMFIVEMTHKAYYYAQKNQRKTLQRNDIAAAITDTEIYDFLLDIMPRDEMINSNKDKTMSQYQLQLLDDVARISKMQTPQQHVDYLKQSQAATVLMQGGNPEIGQQQQQQMEEMKESEGKKSGSVKKEK